MNNLEHPDKFVNRHIGPRMVDVNEMLKAVGVATFDQLINETIPSSIRLRESIELSTPVTEYRFIANLKKISVKNKILKSYIGLGYYDTITPAVIQRNILENPGWYTQYTPYQAEISQGRLEALINFQTVITDLTGLKIANASLLDEGTAAAEAMIMFYSLRKEKNAHQFFVSEECFPQTIDVLKTRSKPLGIDLVIGDHTTMELNENIFGLIVQYPSDKGEVYDYRNLFSKAKKNNIYIIIAADLLSLTLLTPPGEFGADCVVGSAQRFGVPMGYGGPHAAFFSTKDEYKRNIPGRIIGASIDSNEKLAFRMALGTREQHIRREKATSNICTSQVLLAIMAGMYAVYHGPDGLNRIAEKIHKLTKVLDKSLRAMGYNQLNKNYFDTLHIDLGDNSNQKIIHIIENATKKEMNFRYFKDGSIGLSINESTDFSDVLDILSVFASAANKSVDENVIINLGKKETVAYPAEFARTTGFLNHPVFNSYHSETEMMRYIKSLENKDLSLMHSMISLGSCTMKLNAATEMLGITWPEFSKIHPFAPVEQVSGYRQIIEELEKDLSAITGFEAVSLQPNSGAQGEYTGLMVIREYNISKGEGHRNVVVIPSSAHGTNPASAVMAGMKVVVINSTSEGNIDIEDLKRKVEVNKDNLAALMITYPSTHGVFEEDVKKICNIIHENGGQVYMDGANMNAQVGLTNPALIGADVCHLNLHKTFCIPHGGGGPGVGPIAVAKHLVPFLPNHSVIDLGHAKGIHSVSSSPWGSANILIISYAYIKMMGSTGLTDATKNAILNANYLKTKLGSTFNVLYSGKNGRVAHELIFDMRKFKETAHIEVEDIAKRLMDYGYHAPTVSFPVPGTLMIEPTESESKKELDKFCEALLSIREEIREIETGNADPVDNVLKNSPHTAEMVISDVWNHAYSREKAAYPTAWTRARKFWPAVGRVNNAYGDRNLVCTCAPVSSYTEEFL